MVSPGAASLSFTNLPLPATEGDDSVTATVTFSPNDDEAGQTFTITFTTTDDNGEATSTDVVIFVSSLSEFAAPFTDAGADPLTACVGQNLQYDPSATDPDVAGTVRFRVDALDAGTPGIPYHRLTITLLTVDGQVLAGPVGGNLQFGRTQVRGDIKIRPGTRVRQRARPLIGN